MAELRITGELDGLESAQREIDKVRDALEPPAITEIMGDGADVFVDLAREHAPVVTGQLERSIDKRVEDPYTWIIAPSVDYAGLVEFGTRAHVIEPSTKKALFREGWAHPASRVEHPGATEEPYMRPAFEEGQEAAVEAVKTSFEKKII